MTWQLFPRARRLAYGAKLALGALGLASAAAWAMPVPSPRDLTQAEQAIQPGWSRQQVHDLLGYPHTVLWTSALSCFQYTLADGHGTASLAVYLYDRETVDHTARAACTGTEASTLAR